MLNQADRQVSRCPACCKMSALAVLGAQGPSTVAEGGRVARPVAQNMTEKLLLSGGQALLRALADEGVELMFGYPGGAALHIYDAVYQQDRVEHILVRHEQGATHAADGYARATGRPGVVLVTSGPGATNTLTGIATAHMDSVPLVVISGQVKSHLIGTDCFQETDMMGCSRPIVKHSFLVRNAESIPLIVRQAMHIATTGRPGPVVIDIPKDCTDPEQTSEYIFPESGQMRSYVPPVRGHSGQVKRAAELLLQARRPVLYAGGGVVRGRASEQLQQLARRLDLPVTTTLMGLGGYPASGKRWLGMLGMHGTCEANLAMHNADLIVAVGARFDDRVTNVPEQFCPGAKIVHIDIDAASISKIIPADVPIVGPAVQVLEDLMVELNGAPPVDISAWHQQIDDWRQAYGLDHNLPVENEGLIKPQRVVQALYRITGGDAYVTSDVGQHQMFAAQYYRFDKPNRWVNSGGLGTMGFGLPAAMGVQLAKPDATVVCVTSEGSIQMCLQELATCAQYGLPIKIININNAALGMVKQWQDMQYGGRYSHSTYKNAMPDFIKLAEGYGHSGTKVTAPAELEDALQQCFATDGLVFMDIDVDPDEHVYPMQIAPGSVCDLWLSKTERI